MKLSIKILIAVAMSLLVISNSNAKGIFGSNNYLIVGSNSYHVTSNNDNADYNETNNAVGLEIELKTDWWFFKDKDKLTVAIYEDSYDKKLNTLHNPDGSSSNARYIAATHFYGNDPTLRYGLMLGVIKGDSYQDGRILPMILPTIVIENKYGGFNILFLPKATSNGSYIFGIQYKAGLDW